MPTVHDIRVLTAERDALRKHRSAPATRATMAPKPKNEIVPWFGWDYKTIRENQMLHEVENHIIRNLGNEKGPEYIKYLISMCKFPEDFMLSFIDLAISQKSGA